MVLLLLLVALSAHLIHVDEWLSIPQLMDGLNRSVSTSATFTQCDPITS